MERLSSLDRLLLRIEQPHHPMDLILTWVLDPTATGPVPFETVRALLAERAVTQPALTHRLVHQPFGIHDERWAPDPSFHIDRHLFRVPADEPIAVSHLAELMAAFGREPPLPRDRPLWQMWYVDELTGGGSALMLRYHHALMDGVASIELIDDLFDHDPEPFVPLDADEPPTLAARHPHPVERAAWLIPDLLTRSVTSATSTLRLGRSVARDAWQASQGTVGRLPRVPERGPRTCLNRRVTTTDKVTAFRTLSMEDITRVRHGFPGANINDVLLALIAGALRRFLTEREAVPTAPLTASMPVNARQGGEPRAFGNHFTYLYATVPVHIEDRTLRLEVVHDRVAAEKERFAGAARQGGSVEVEGPHILPSRLWGPLGSFLTSPVFELVPPVVNLSISTVPGPRRPWYVAGSRVAHMFTTVPTMPPIQLFFISFGYLDNLEIGMTAFRETVPDPEGLMDVLVEELAAYVDLAGPLIDEQPVVVPRHHDPQSEPPQHITDVAEGRPADNP